MLNITHEQFPKPSENSKLHALICDLLRSWWLLYQERHMPNDQKIAILREEIKDTTLNTKEQIGNKLYETDLLAIELVNTINYIEYAKNSTASRINRLNPIIPRHNIIAFITVLIDELKKTHTIIENTSIQNFTKKEIKELGKKEPQLLFTIDNFLEVYVIQSSQKGHENKFGISIKKAVN